MEEYCRRVAMWDAYWQSRGPSSLKLLWMTADDWLLVIYPRSSAFLRGQLAHFAGAGAGSDGAWPVMPLK